MVAANTEAMPAIVHESLDTEPVDPPPPEPTPSDLPPQAWPIEPDTSVGELFSRVSKDLGELMSMHVQLAKTELREEVVESVNSAKFLGIAAFAGYLAILMASAASALGIGEWLGAWAGFAIVAALWALVAVVMALQGRSHLQQVEPPLETVETVKGDVAWAQQQRS